MSRGVGKSEDTFHVYPVPLAVLLCRVYSDKPLAPFEERLDAPSLSKFGGISMSKDLSLSAWSTLLLYTCSNLRNPPARLSLEKPDNSSIFWLTNDSIDSTAIRPEACSSAISRAASSLRAGAKMRATAVPLAP